MTVRNKKRVTTTENYNKALERKTKNRNKDTIHLRSKIEARIKELEQETIKVCEFIKRLELTTKQKREEKISLESSILALKDILNNKK